MPESKILIPRDEAQHDQARRLARLIVTEILLENEAQVAEGRRHLDLYERLKNDIDKARLAYEERVHPDIVKVTDYF